MKRTLFFGPAEPDADWSRLLETIVAIAGVELVPALRPHRRRPAEPTRIMSLLAQYYRCDHILEAFEFGWSGRRQVSMNVMVADCSQPQTQRLSAVSDADEGLHGLLAALHEMRDEIATSWKAHEGAALGVEQRLAVARYLDDRAAIDRLVAERDGDISTTGVRAGDAVDLHVGGGAVPGIVLELRGRNWCVLCGTCDLIMAPPNVTPRTDPRPAPGITIIVNDLSPRLVHLPEGRHSLGRHQANDVPLDDSIASQQHAEITVHDGRATVRDLGSTSGIGLNHERVGREERDLAVGDDVRLGQTILHVVALTA